MNPPPRHILLAVTGSVAAYKAAELVRLWVKTGHTVEVALSEAASHFIGAATFQALSGRPVLQSMWGEHDDGMAHIHASRRADLMVIAPASADTLARLAQGRASDLIASLALARDCPLLIAPAMNRQMWLHPATQRNLAQILADGAHLVAPGDGVQACGETGPGRMAEPDEIIAACARLVQPQTLAGKTVLMTAGPTFEAIDPVRGLSNLSSGKMGFALANALRQAGAHVQLVAGPVCLATPDGVERIDVVSALEMHAAVMARVATADVFIGVAAVADFRPAAPAGQKLKKSAGPPTIGLVANPDILAEVAALPHAPFCVGFAAETENLIAQASAKRQRKHLPLLIANLATESLGQDSTAMVLLDASGTHPLPHADKPTQAQRIVDHLSRLLKTPT